MSGWFDNQFDHGVLHERTDLKAGDGQSKCPVQTRHATVLQNIKSGTMGNRTAYAELPGSGK